MTVTMANLTPDNRDNKRRTTKFNVVYTFHIRYCQGFMQDQIIASHTCFSGHMDVNCWASLQALKYVW